MDITLLNLVENYISISKSLNSLSEFIFLNNNNNSNLSLLNKWLLILIRGKC